MEAAPDSNAVNLIQFVQAGYNSPLDVLRGVLETIPDAAVILDADRRVLAANSRFLDVVGLTEHSVTGRRPGDLFGCLFHTEGPAGCGTGAHCTVCGAFQSIMDCQLKGRQAVHECQIVRGGDETGQLDLEVTATSLAFDEIPVIVCVLRDVSLEKHRTLLERLFYHDAINTVGGIHGLAEILCGMIDLTPEQEMEYKQWLLGLSKRLIDEIIHQRKLMEAERGDFVPELGLVSAGDLLREIQTLFAGHEVADGRILELGECCNCCILSDRQILRRILGNLVKNALEATPPGGRVTVSSSDGDGMVTIQVHNPGEIPPEVQLQLFRRFFSTTGGSGRGIGTYSVKLFAERYLKGKVSFSSSEPEGTTFIIAIPKNLHLAV